MFSWPRHWWFSVRSRVWECIQDSCPNLLTWQPNKDLTWQLKWRARSGRREPDPLMAQARVPRRAMIARKDSWCFYCVWVFSEQLVWRCGLQIAIARGEDSSSDRTLEWERELVNASPVLWTLHFMSSSCSRPLDRASLVGCCEPCDRPSA